MKISSVAEMRAMDQAALDDYGIPPELLMENAGHAVVTTISNIMEIEGHSFIVFCGLGNNGGDGWVIARKLHSCGGMVRVLSFGPLDKYTDAARINAEIVSRLKIEVEQVTEISTVRAHLQNCDAVVDAIFGTGLAREVVGIYREVIQAINSCERPVFSVDIPSGVNGDNGQVLGIAVRADQTVTFGLPKTGNLLYPGFAHCGKLTCSHISFPPELYSVDSLHVNINTGPLLPPRTPDGHKGDFGDVLFVAGATGYYGAPYFAAYSFMKAGGGYARLAAPRSVVPVVASKGSEIVFYPQEETASGALSLQNLEALEELSVQVDMIAIGSGISLDKESQNLVRCMATRINKPVLIDGDGLTAIANYSDLICSRLAPTILTPHLGEMSRITGLDILAIQKNPVAVLREFSSRLHAVIVLKGAHTLVGLPNGQVYLNLSGNSGMASAGSGDVLTGTIAAMVGLGLNVEDAARKGVFIHGLAGDLAAHDLGEDGITAQDILEYLPVALRWDRVGLPIEWAERYKISEIP